jgi:hypothetical protein
MPRPTPRNQDRSPWPKNAASAGSKEILGVVAERLNGGRSNVVHYACRDNPQRTFNVALAILRAAGMYAAVFEPSAECRRRRPQRKRAL